MSGLSCRGFAELLTEFLDGALDELAERHFLEHQRECSDCERYLDEFRITICTVRRLPAETIPDDDRDRLLTAFHTWRSAVKS
jgi:hypothetical protein